MNTIVPQQASLLADNTRSTQFSIHFHANAHVLIHDMTSCDVRKKLQCIKTPVVVKPSGISPNHTCQYVHY